MLSYWLLLARAVLALMFGDHWAQHYRGNQKELLRSRDKIWQRQRHLYPNSWKSYHLHSKALLYDISSFYHIVQFLAWVELSWVSIGFSSHSTQKRETRVSCVITWCGSSCWRKQQLATGLVRQQHIDAASAIHDLNLLVSSMRAHVKQQWEYAMQYSDINAVCHIHCHMKPYWRWYVHW